MNFLKPEFRKRLIRAYIFSSVLGETTYVHVEIHRNV